MRISSINYCLTFELNASKANTGRPILQTLAAIMILNAAPDEPSKPLFEKIGSWLNVFELISLHQCMFHCTLCYVKRCNI
jgi:hypothetical protein